ncbi:Cell division protein borealin [Cinara cedri]|uniref:Cell division protein borealin n=1 Tax=Cinara cedri TaxID=506608 RepID=A0A5E4NHT4_9HEMI|nr:Cell division protein borealin [Cinara cedri]
MPRTKRTTVKRSTANLNMSNMSDNITMANQPKNIKDILEDFDVEKTNIENEFAELLDEQRNIIENKFLIVRMNLSGSLDTNLYDYIEEDIAEKNVSKKAARPTRTLTKATGSRTIKPISASRATSLKSNKIATKHHSAVRAVDDRAPLLEKNNEPSSKFKTPLNRPPMTAAATITPKVNMNEPISMMRRPNQGEVAYSVTGSPVMVSSITRDDMATVCVPLANGNVLSILPRAGGTMDISLNDQTKHELLLLKGNIEVLLKKDKHS